MQPISVNINKQERSPQEIVSEIKKINQPQLVLWYIGDEGLKSGGVKWYRAKVLSQLVETDVNCWLYDLSSWDAFKTKGSEKFNIPDENVAIINNLGVSQFKSIASSSFFEWIQNQSNGAFVDVLKNEEIYLLSKNKNTDIKIGHVFKDCKILEEIKDQDSGLCYSALQYIEAYYLIRKIAAEKLLEQINPVNIVFALPDEEWEYYKCDNFEKDLNRLFAIDEIFNQNIKINVSILAMKYSNLKDEKGKRKVIRPYSYGPNFSKKLTLNEICGKPEAYFRNREKKCVS